MSKEILNALFAGALASALLLGANHFSPLLSPLLMLMPLPILAVGLLYGLRSSLLATAFLAVAAWVEAPGLLYPVLNVGAFALFPILAAQLLRMGWGTVQCGVVAFLLGGAGLLGGLLLSQLTGVELESLLVSQMDLIREGIVQALRESGGMDAAQMAEVEAGLTYSFRTAALLLLGGIGLGWFMIQTINLMVARVLAIRWRIPLVMEDLERWRLPDWLVWPLITCIFAALMGEGFVRFLGINMGIYLTAPYFLQGVAVVQSAFGHYHTQAWVRGMFYALLMFWIEFALLVAAVGLFDTWVDFRQRFFAARKTGLPPGGDNGHGSDSA